MPDRVVGGTEYSWVRAVLGGTGITVLGILSGSVSISLLESALRRLKSSHPLLRSRLIGAATGQPSFTLHASNSLPPLSISSANTLPPPPLPSASPLHAIVEHELNQNSWSSPAADLPVLFATVYDMPEAVRTAVALRLHTAVCDRTSAVAILKELLDLMAGSEEAVDREPLDGINQPIEELIPKDAVSKPFWVRGKDLLGYSLNVLRTSTLRFEETRGDQRRSEVVRLVLSNHDTDRLVMECKERGIKLCGAISAATMVAACASKQLENDQYENYSVVTLVDCRKYLNPVLHDQNIGFYHSAIINTHSIYKGEDLWEVAQRCQTSYSNALDNKKHLKDMGEINFLMCRGIENPHLTPSSSLRTALVSVFDEPVVYESSKLQQEFGVEDYIGCSSVHGVGPSIAVFDTIRDGQLDCACVYPSPLHSRKQIQELVEHIKRLLRGGATNGEPQEIEKSTV